jgi:NodT family efflux transporter outer membrane factor (OMF) lipoprotein
VIPPTRTRLVLLLAVAAPTLACVKAPPPSPTPDVVAPRAWTAPVEPGSSLPTDAEWWRDFGDPGLTASVEAALAGNRDLRAAAARVERAAAQARIAGADLKPSAAIGLDGSRRRQNFIGLPIPGSGGILSTTSTSLGVSLDVAWEPDLWGRLRAGARAALADLQASEADLAGARLSLAGQAAKTYVAVAEATGQLDLARRTAEARRASFEQIERRYRSGLRGSLDVRLARSDLANANALVRLRERQRDALQRQFAVLLGLYPETGGTDRDGLPAMPSAVPAGLPADLIARRPDLVAAERRLAAADQRLVASRRALYPRLTLTASGGTVSDRLGDLLDGDFRVWSLLGGLTQPLFQGGRLRAGVDAAEATRVEAIEAYAATALAAYAEVETALAADVHLAGRIEDLEDAVHQVDRALRLAEDRYERGLEPYVTVLESRSRLLAAETQYLAARRERLENRIDLYLALGGGFVRPGSADGAAAGDDLAAGLVSEDRTEH